jgi:hypothetical protein
MARITTRDWLHLLSDVRALAMPLPESADQVDAWMERIKEPVAHKVAEDLKVFLQK